MEIFNLFNHRVYGSTDPDVKIGKPAPDIFLVACKRFGDKPKPADVSIIGQTRECLIYKIHFFGQCLVFEDAPNGVRAACLAGMQSVMVPDKNVSQELRKEATIVIDSLEQFQPEIFGLPPFDDEPNNRNAY